MVIFSSSLRSFFQPRMFLIIFVLSSIFGAQLCFSQNEPIKGIATFAGGPSKLAVSNGLTLQNEFVLTFKRFFAVGTNLTYATAHEGIENEIITFNTLNHISARSVEDNLISIGIQGYFTPIKNNSHLLLIGSGPNINYYRSTFIELNPADESFSTLSQNNSNRIGFSLSAQYCYRLGKHWGLGAKAFGSYSDANNEAILLSVAHVW